MTDANTDWGTVLTVNGPNHDRLVSQCRQQRADQGDKGYHDDQRSETAMAPPIVSIITV
jgi:hypothetical protein